MQRHLREIAGLFAFALVAAALPAVSAGQAGGASPTDARVVAANTDFAFRLFDAVREREGRNGVLLAPASIGMALAMTYNGARGETQEAMAKALGLQGIPLAQVNQANAALSASLKDPGPKARLDIANSLWADRRTPLLPDFVRRNQEAYGARVENVTFGAPGTLDLINGWVGRQTEGMIRDLLKPDDLTRETALVLLNAIYFKGAWSVPFDPARTRSAPFTLPDGTEKSVPMMTQSGSFRYLEGEGFKAVALPYGSGRLSFYAVVPKPDTTLGALLQSLDAGRWEQWMARFEKRPGSVSIPRFKMEDETELSKPLTALGMGVAFTARADFGGITAQPVWITRVRHKSVMEVNEEGTTAAGATAVITGRGRDPGAFSFVANRPFFCAIRDDKTGALLFMGTVVDPSGR